MTWHEQSSTKLKLEITHMSQWEFLLGDPVPKSEKQLWGCIIIQVIYHYMSTQILWVSGKALALLSKG